MNAYHERLFAGLDNDPEKYVFTGTVVDRGRADGACECGHAIRYEYLVKNVETGKVKTLGSDCINTYEFLGHIKEQVAEKEKQDKELKEKILDEKINELFSARDTLIEKLVEIRSKYIRANAFVPQHVYWGSNKNNFVKLGKYKRKSTYLRKIEEEIVKLSEVYESHKNDEIEVVVEKPTEKQVGLIRDLIAQLKDGNEDFVKQYEDDSAAVWNDKKVASSVIADLLTKVKEVRYDKWKEKQKA